MFNMLHFHLCLQHFSCSIEGLNYDLMWDHFKTRYANEASQVNTIEEVINLLDSLEVKSMNVSDVKMTDEDSFLSNSMMIKAKNIIMKERIWINGVINENTFETHCEATGHFPPVRQYRNVDDCRVHKCEPIQGRSSRLHVRMSRTC